LKLKGGELNKSQSSLHRRSNQQSSINNNIIKGDKERVFKP